LLTGLDVAAASGFLPGFDAQALARAHAATRGSPAMLGLLASLCRDGEPPERAVQQLESSPSLEVMVRRVWQRLDEPSRELLAALSVHRGSAPADTFSGQHTLLMALQTRDLVRHDGGGGVALPTYVRDFVLAAVPAELRPALHVRAARSYEERAQFTAAAWHYIQAREPAMAVWVWHAHRAAETAQGRAVTARNVFSDVSMEELPAPRDRQAFALLRAEWARAAGEPDAGLAALDAVSWPATHPQMAYTQQLRGQLHEMRGEVERAVEAFRKGLRQLTETPAQREAELRASLAYARYRQGELQQAHLHAIEAQVRAQGFRGFVEWHMGNAGEATRELGEAVVLARKHPVSPSVLQAALVQAGVQLWQTGRAAEAQTVLAEALALANRTGDALGAQYLRLNLAAAALTAGNPGLALEHASVGLAMGETMRHAYLIAGNSINAAEAELALGRVDAAYAHAMRALNQEEGSTMPGALTVLGRIQLARSTVGDAVRSLQLASTIAEGNVDRFGQAHALFWLARACQQLNPPDEMAANSAAEQAQALFTSLGIVPPA
jgi:tetratricopeptide (TPR) repeat protein